MKNFLKNGGLVLVGSTVAIPAFAAVPASVTTALGDMSTDSITIASLSFVVFIGILAFTYYRRAAK